MHIRCYLLVLILWVASSKECLNAQTFTRDQIIKLVHQEDVTHQRVGISGTNCASISVIKAAIQTFGLENVLVSSRQTENGYTVTLRDGKPVSITNAELQKMATLDRFFGDETSPLFKKARFYYAIMAKNKQLSELSSYPTIESAASYIDPQDGKVYLQLQTDTEANLKFLGLENNYQNKFGSADISSFSNVIITNLFHSAYGSSGTYDEFGTPTSTRRFVRLHGHVYRISGAYVLTP